MSKSQPIQTDSSVFAVLHHSGEQWRVVIASSKARPTAIIDTREFSDAGSDRIQTHLDENRVSRVIFVLPASSVVCRTCTLPDADAEQLEQALALQAETYLTGTGPAYRMGNAVLPLAAGETSRSGIIVSWPESAHFDLPEVGDRPMTFAPDVAGLAALLNGLRPSEPMLWLDPASGSLSLAVTHANGAVFRSTREEASADEDWSQRVARALAETALSVGHTAAFVDGLVARSRTIVSAGGTDEPLFSVPPEVRDSAADRLTGIAEDARWWSHYGIAAGVAIAATGPLASLTNLQDTPEQAAPSRIANLAEKLSTPRAAIVTVAICLLILGLAPAIAQGMRLLTLKVRHANLDDQLYAISLANEKVDLYQALDTEAWPMTKLLSDIVSNLPEGIELDVMRVDRDGESFTVSGISLGNDRAKLNSQELVVEAMRRMESTGIFEPVKPTWGDANSYGHYKFDLAAKIRRPHREPRYDIDQRYEEWTLASRQRGEGPPTGSSSSSSREERSAAAPPERVASTNDANRDPDPRDDGSTGSDRESRAPARSNDRTVLGDGPPRGTTSRTDPGSSGPDPGRIPAPLTEAQISAMSRDETLSMLTTISEADKRLRSSDDKELKERLKSERQMLMAHLREVSNR